MASCSDESTVRECREAYFKANGFDESGYSKNWVPVKIGPLPLGFPNTKSRKQAVKRHDIHHVLTGYEATLVGEAEIGAWELAGGCGPFPAAWVLNLLAVVIGLFLSPGAVLKAWRRGRREENLYYRPWDDAWLDMKVGELRRLLRISPR